MPRSATRQRTFAPPPLLGQIIRACADDPRTPAHGRSMNRASMLHDLARLFMIAVPMHGVSEPGDDLRNEIERMANRHLRRGRADARLRAALGRIGSVQERDAIENAHLEVVELSELAHYYAGLAAGLTLAEMGRQPR